MRFYFYVTDPSLKDCNGASLVMAHQGHALEVLGHSFELISLHDEVPTDADFVFFQSEWWNVLKQKLERSTAKRVCWVGHFLNNTEYGMPELSTIKADFYHTQYVGKAVEWAEKKIGQPLIYLPHAGCHVCNGQGEIIENVPKTLIVMASYKERREDWIEYAGVNKVKAPYDKVKDLYASALVCPNLHGDWQKGEPCALMHIPAFMINDRLFQVVLSGGFAVSDNNPIVKEFFEESEIPYANTREEYKRMIEFFAENPEKRLPFMKRAKKRVLKEHLYTHRMTNFLKEIL